MRLEYVELVPHERIVFTFGRDPTDGAPDVAPGSTRVEVSLTADGDDTILALRHSGLPTSVADEHRSGWGHSGRCSPLPPQPGRTCRADTQAHRCRPRTGPRSRPRRADVEAKPMFGNLGAFVNGHMGLFGSDIGVKLDEPDRADLVATPGTGPFGPAERPMAGYVTLSAAWTARRAEPWVAKAHAATAALPARQPKAKRKKPAS